MGIFLSCGSPKADLDNAKFEIEQGNLESARRYLERVPLKSPLRAKADSLLKIVEKR